MKMLTTRLRIKPLYVVIILAPTLALGAFLFKRFFPFSSQRSGSAQKEKSSRTIFLENVMIREGGLYTLLGSKPVTEFDPKSVHDVSEEGIKKRYERRNAILEKAKSETHLPEEQKTVYIPDNARLPSYEQYKKQWEKNKHLAKVLNCKKLWEDWQKEGILLDEKFLLFTRKSPHGNSILGLFVNIPNLVYVLYRYRQEFAHRTGLSFKPEEEVLQIQNEASLFWNKVFQDHFLLGIIFGYGEKNAYLFEWSNTHLPSIGKEKSRFALQHGKRVAHSRLRIKSDISPRDLPLPTYFHFGISDPKKRGYEAEREQLVDHFHSKPFESEVMRILKGE